LNRKVVEREGRGSTLLVSLERWSLSDQKPFSANLVRSQVLGEERKEEEGRKDRGITRYSL